MTGALPAPPMRAFALLAVLALVAGCTTPAETPPPPPPPAPPAMQTHVLQGTFEPTELAAPTFKLLGALAKAGPVYGGGEPSVWAALDGSLAVAFPGCDAGLYLVTVPGQDSCGHGLVYRTADDGATWTRLNREGDGRYSDDGPDANGDAEVATDAAGTLYASNLGGDGIQVHAWSAGNWTYLGNVVEKGESADRQWMAAGAPGHLIVAWMGSGRDADGQAQGRAVILNTTFDGGATWTGALAVGSEIGWLGPVAFAPDATTAYIPFTEARGGLPTSPFAGSQDFTMKVGRTHDGGRTWEVLDTGAAWRSTATGGHWSGVHMAPALDVTGDGTVVLAYSTDENAPGDATNTGAVIHVLTSPDGGATWTAAADVQGTVSGPAGGVPAPAPGSSIMPWVAGGAGDRYAIAYFYTPSPVDQDYGGATWDLRVRVVDGAGANATMAETIVDSDVHLGGICTRGGICLATGSDRALLDFFETDVTPDGRLFIAYPADPLQGGKYIEIRTALQSGGTRLLDRPQA